MLRLRDPVFAVLVVASALGGCKAPDGAPVLDASAQPSSAHPADAQSAPHGTFLLSARTSVEGMPSDDALIERVHRLKIKQDGTAQMSTKYSASFKDIVLAGCDQGQKAGSFVTKHSFSVIRNGAVIILDRQGRVEVSQIEPPCWTYPRSAESSFQGQWPLLWMDGRLMDSDGNYFDQVE